MARLSVAEVIEKLQKTKTKNERIEILRQNDSLALRGILRLNYDANLKLDLPDGIPPYKKSTKPVGFGDSTLLTSAKSWYVFTKSGAPNLAQAKREFLFIKLLESLDWVEADIMLRAKDKKLNLGLSKLAINEVFPNLIKDEVETEQQPLEDEDEAQVEHRGTLEDQSVEDPEIKVLIDEQPKASEKKSKKNKKPKNRDAKNSDKGSRDSSDV